MNATQTNQTLDLKNTGFSNLTEALEYAAQGDTGYNFYDGRGSLSTVMTYAQLRDQAKTLARKLLGLGCVRGTRVGIIAETDPLFHRFFFACQYAGFIPVAVPAGVQLGAHSAYVEQIRRMLDSCGAEIAVAPDSHASFLAEASEGLSLVMTGVGSEFDRLPEVEVEFQPLDAAEPAYIQYTSGSTRFPRGVEISQTTVLVNLTEIAVHGLSLVREDRFVSWLPLYHDMGLVGFVLVPLTSQLSADYLSPRNFAMRPRLWLKMISDNQGTISSSPTFGYALCAKRLRPSDMERYDLSSWRAACVGAENINPERLKEFANATADAGFDPAAWVACYGMAECALAISFAPLSGGLNVDFVDKESMAATGLARPVDDQSETASHYTDCGAVLPSFEYAIRDDHGIDLDDRQCGRIFLKGPSVMSGYFQDFESTREVLSADGWLDTGDIGYLIGSHIVITSRRKDVIIIHGRNIWPQDLEMLAERVDGVRLGGVSAFSVSDVDNRDLAVLIVETRERDPGRRNQMIDDISVRAHEHLGIHVYIELAKPRTLRRTSSGKLSRSQNRLAFLERTPADALCHPQGMGNAWANG